MLLGILVLATNRQQQLFDLTGRETWLRRLENLAHRRELGRKDATHAPDAPGRSGHRRSAASTSTARTVVHITRGTQRLHRLDKIFIRTDTVSVVEILVTDEFKAWYEDLRLEEQLPVDQVVDLLGERGVALGMPYSSAIEGSQYALRELRIQVLGRPFRIFYAFDPKRQAVLLIGGDKTGRDRFYDEMIPTAEGLWEEYLRDTAND